VAGADEDAATAVWWSERGTKVAGEKFEGIFGYQRHMIRKKRKLEAGATEPSSTRIDLAGLGAALLRPYKFSARVAEN
jgi:hypothetical protein